VLNIPQTEDDDVGSIDIIKVFYAFLFRSRFFYVFNVFSLFLFKKTLSNAKYDYAKIQRKILLEDAVAMIFY